MAPARSRRKPDPVPSQTPPTPPAGNGAVAPADASVRDLLQRATEEAARLLGADGALLYLVDESGKRLRFTHDAGLEQIGAGHWIRGLVLDVGMGMFGRAVAERRVVLTGDYDADTSFPHAEGPDRFVAETGLRSLVVAPLVAGDEVFGALGTFSRERDAFTPPQVALVRALADHAALAMANTRLIAELARSRAAIERQAGIERALRELGTRISGARDPEAIVQLTIDEALRQLGGDGARIDIVDQEANQLRGVYSAGQEQILASEWPRDDPGDRLEVGASGRAVVTGRTYISPDYLADGEIVHGHGPDTYARNKGIRGVIAAPLFGDQGPFGAITVWSTRPDAFGPEHAALLETIAGQAAVALARARLIQELGRSREALARRAEEERVLREIGGRLSQLGDQPGDVLLRIVHEAARLLGAERARLDLQQPVMGATLWTFPADRPFEDAPILDTPADEPPVGLAALAVREGRAVASDDYAHDRRFVHYEAGDRGVADAGLHSVMAAPVVSEDGLLGVIQAGTRRAGGFSEDALRLLETLADQAAIAITNARLVDRLAGSQAELARIADGERALREIGRRLMRIQDPGELLQDVVEEATRLLGPAGAVIDLLDPATGEVRWAYDAGIDAATRSEWQRRGAVDGVRRAIRERRVVVSPDYPADPRFADAAAAAGLFAAAGIRSVAFAPLIGESTVRGTLSVFAHQAGRFGDQQAALLAALADLATIAIHNAELIAELGRSREETARRAENERTLREIAARVTAIRDPDAILGLIVDEARRVLGSDGAHLTRMSEDGTYLSPVVVAGGMDEETRAWLRTQVFPLEGGINGLAAAQGRVIWTPNYVTDPRIPREPDDLDVAARMGLGAMAAAPLRAPGGEVIGTLAVSYRNPGPIATDRLATLQALADHAAIALSNSDLLARLAASEGSYRRLVQATPDVIWRNDAEGRFTFIAEGAEALFGWPPAELVGQHFSFIVAPEAIDDATAAWQRLASTPDAVWRLPFLLRRRDGTTFPAEVSAVSSFQDGVLSGAQGTLRDVSERERLERELRESEERYRSVIQSSPDLIWATNRSGRYVFVSDRVRDLLGWEPEEVLGRPFREFIAEASVAAANEDWTRLALEPGRTQTQRLDLRHRDGSLRPFEVSSLAVVRDGQVENVYGIARDIAERERLERELRESEERYRFLVENSPDIIYAMDADGVITYFSESVERVLGWTPAEVMGRHFRDMVRTGTGAPTGRRFAELARGVPDMTTRMELVGRDGVFRPFEVTASAIRENGEFAGVHGAARDIGERERLEHELRDSEERYRYLVQSSPDLVWMTDADGRFTFVSDQAEAILGWSPVELLGRSFADLAPDDGRRGAVARFRYLQRRPTEAQRSRVRVRTRDGRVLSMEITGIGMLQDGTFVGAHGAARDVSERERLERDLRRQAGELASSEERAHLARELHDSVTQALFSMTLLSRSAEILLQKDPAQVPAKLAALRELQRDALAEMRALIFELRPGNVEEHGLVEALRTHGAALSGRIGLAIVVEADLPERPPIEVEETLYRIAQEALHNVVKHAGAHQVRLDVGAAPGAVRLRVIDDGRGFDPGAVPDGHMGLTGMRARAERLGGQIDVSSVPGRGTTVEVVIPVPATGKPAAGSPGSAQ